MDKDDMIEYFYRWLHYAEHRTLEDVEGSGIGKRYLINLIKEHIRELEDSKRGGYNEIN